MFSLQLSTSSSLPPSSKDPLDWGQLELQACLYEQGMIHAQGGRKHKKGWDRLQKKRIGQFCINDRYIDYCLTIFVQHASLQVSQGVRVKEVLRSSRRQIY